MGLVIEMIRNFGPTQVSPVIPRGATPRLTYNLPTGRNVKGVETMSKYILSAIGGFVIGVITSLFDLGWFTDNWELNPPGIIVNAIFCSLWILFVYFALRK